MGMAITFAQQKGGSGKTTLLTNLAHAFALKGQNIALLDLDPQGSLTAWAALADFDALTLLETASYRVGSDIRSAKERYDLVLVDCPGSAASVLEAAIRESDLVLVPCQPSKMDLWASKPATDMAADEGTPARIVLNRVPPRGGLTEEVASELGTSIGKVLKTRIGNRIAYARGFGEGTTALGLPGQPQAKAEIKDLQGEVAKLLRSL